MGHYGLGHWRVLSLASDFRAVWLVWIQVGERASGKAFGAKTLRLLLRFTELLYKVCDLGFDWGDDWQCLLMRNIPWPTESNHSKFYKCSQTCSTHTHSIAPFWQVMPRPIIRSITDCGGLCELTAIPTATTQSPLTKWAFLLSKTYQKDDWNEWRSEISKT